MASASDNAAESRQPLLQRADWRFLLPARSAEPFEHLLILGGPPGLAARLEEAGAARHVSSTPPRGGLVDALAVLHDSPVPVDVAVRALAPGGALYYEVRRDSPGRLLATPARTRQALRRLGLSPAGTYAVLPGFAEHQYKKYIPIERSDGLDWYLSTLHTASSLPQHALARGARRLSRLSKHRFAAGVPKFALTATRGDACRQPLPILRCATRRQERSMPELQPALLTNGIDDSSRVVMLPFAQGTAQPAFVLKIARTAEFNANVEREQCLLAKIASRLSPELRRTIPSPLGAFPYQGLAAGAESYAAGRSILALGWQWGRSMEDQAEDLQLASDWIAEFHRQMHISNAAWGDEALGPRIETSLAEFAAAFGSTPDERKLFDGLRRHASELADIELPIVWRGNDFGPWNVYRDGRDLTVIDWEFEREVTGPALCDLLYFVAHWSFAVRKLHTREEQLAGFRQLFLEPDAGDRAVRLARQAIREYLLKLSVEPRYLPVLLVYTWVEPALERRSRQRSFSLSAAEARAMSHFAGYIGVLAEHREQLFANSPPVWS